jgi:hypothetical protein
MTQVRKLDVGKRFFWRNAEWIVRSRGTTYVEVQNVQFSNFELFRERASRHENSWLTEVRVVGEVEPNPPWTPRELIESLSKWHPDQPIEVAYSNNATNPFEVDISLVQNTNSILLTKGRT